jgi:hypothetical protein
VENHARIHNFTRRPQTEFSTEFIQQVTELFVAELEAQLAGQEEIQVAQLETTLREMLRRVGGQCVSEYLTAQEFGNLLWATGCQWDADLAREIVFVADGATWIWKLVEHYFPDAVQIVDWYHAEIYLQPIAKEAFADAPEADQQRWQTVRTDLWKGQVDRVITACAQFEGHPQAGEAAKKAVTYFTNNQYRMDYARFRYAGYMIGSGTVESGCKQIVTQRLKCSGACRTVPGAVVTAKARAAWLSGQWDQLAMSRSQLPLAA